MTAAASDRERWNARHRAAGGRGDAPSAWVLEHAGLLAAAAPGRALDVACGRGRNAFLLAGLGFSVDALDVSDVAIDAVELGARTRGADVRARRADLSGAVAFPRPPYAVVLDVMFLERSLFGALEDALAAGGLLVVEAFTDHARVPGRAAGARFALAPNELLRAFPSLRVLAYDEVAAGDARPRGVARLVARREGAGG